MNKYNPKDIEPKWQAHWEKEKTFEVKDDPKKQKFFGLIEFPYPSGAGLHVGHPRSFTAMDVVARKKRMEGLNVLYPIGFDAFGLPTENYAIKTGRPPIEVTAENIATFTRQLKSLGFSFDWSRSVDTTDPAYYRWTQWIFLQFFKHGLAYKKKQPINWCPKDQIGLANEEVVDGCCERCGGPVEKRDKEQWMLAITKYADSLLEGLDAVDYIERAKVQQKNWIGRSEGASVIFEIPDFKLQTLNSKQISNSEIQNGENGKVEIFTTRPDTIFGATFLAVSATLAKKWMEAGWEASEEMKSYVQTTLAEQAKASSREEEKEKTGVDAGIKAVNPVTKEEIPVWITNYVMGDVGTGAIMAVPAHDERDFDFAKKYNLPIKIVVIPNEDDQPEESLENKIIFYTNETLEKGSYHRDGRTVNSDFINGLSSTKAREKMIQYLEEQGIGKRKVNYKLRDWVFSRQRYWGEPIPLVHCEACANKKYNYIIIHGLGSNSQQGFKVWLKDELEKKGHTVWSPDLPNTATPNAEEQTAFIIENAPFAINENTVLIGHSLGGVVTYTLLEKIKNKVAKVVLVDPVYSAEFTDKPRSAVEKSTDWKFNWKKIKDQANDFVILGDKNFSVIREQDLRDLRDTLTSTLRLVEPSVPHFSSVEKINGSLTVEPTILEAALPDAWITLPESELPLKLPQVEKYQPTDTGESPLAAMTDWVKTACPKCGGEARRETDTMPNWAGSSWYFLRYMDPKNETALASPEALKYWAPVDWYNGGMEHTVLHLLYSRFWNQFLFDIGVVPTKEPYAKRTSHGMILASDGEKMSKSRGNVVNPDDMVAEYGADALRTYILFMGPFDQAVAWDTNGLVGVRRFLDRVWNLQEKILSPVSETLNSKLKTNSNTQIQNSKIVTVLHQTIKKVGDDIEGMRFNTAVAKLMELTNELMKEETISRDTYHATLKLVSPFAPHLAEELWSLTGGEGDIAYAPWPIFDPGKMIEQTATIAIQVNGKLRATIEVATDESEEVIKEKALANENVVKWMEGKVPKKVIYVKGKLVSIVI